MERKFKKGDRVKRLANGDIGTIIHVSAVDYLVEFDISRREYHSGAGVYPGVKGKDGHCWWSLGHDLELVKESHTFKIGDKVRIRAWADMEKEFGLDGAGDVKCRYYFCEGMRHLCGRTATITKIDSDGEIKLNFNDKSGDTEFNYSTDMIEPIRNNAIVIYRNGNEVIALDKVTGKKGVAKCSPADTFNFETGAKLAFERLMSIEPRKGIEPPKATAKKPEPKFKPGDKVKVLDGKGIENYCGGWVKSMAEKIGKTFTVREVNVGDGCIGYYLKEICFIWDERGLELVPEYKFKVGDKVVGNAKADKNYSFTRRGWKGTVTEVNEYGFRADGFCLKYDCFDLAPTPKINIGDKVKVINCGKNYSTYRTWFNHIGKKELAAHFVNGSRPDRDTKYNVVAIGNHEHTNSPMCAIQNPKTTQIFIIDEEGVEKVD